MRSAVVTFAILWVAAAKQNGPAPAAGKLSPPILAKPPAASLDQTAAASTGQLPSVYMIGNSYIYTNNVPQVVDQLLTARYKTDIRVGSYAQSSYTLVNHTADLKAGRGSLKTDLSKGWSHVVLQEQSQVPGFWVDTSRRPSQPSSGAVVTPIPQSTSASRPRVTTMSTSGSAGSNTSTASAASTSATLRQPSTATSGGADPDGAIIVEAVNELYRDAGDRRPFGPTTDLTQHPIWQASYTALEQLAPQALALSKAKQLILFSTWGYKAGDPLNHQFPTYDVMQRRVIQGTLAYALKLVDLGINATIAPVGTAFMLVQQRENRTGAALKLDDLTGSNNHPTVVGTYLVGVTIAGTVAGGCLKGVQYNLPSVTAAQAAYLQDISCTAQSLMNTILGEYIW